jgi:hypothetical protein
MNYGFHLEAVSFYVPLIVPLKMSKKLSFKSLLNSALDGVVQSDELNRQEEFVSLRWRGYCWRIPNPAISMTSNQGIQAGLLNEPPAV